MIIDLILDRKDGDEYRAGDFYFEVLSYRDIWPDISDPITRAMDYGTEADVRRELCKYIDEQGYNPKIKKYINSVNWISEDWISEDNGAETLPWWEDERRETNQGIQPEPALSVYHHPQYHHCRR